MAYYWAKFKNIDNQLYRFDTRIYLQNVDEVLESDICIGAIVGKNPGSAIPIDMNKERFSEITLNNDKLLPTIRNLLLKSCNQTTGRIYIQVLNLFYLCNPDLNEAIKNLENNMNPETCYSEKNKFPWIWFVWGGHHEKLSIHKSRFKTVKSNRFFYLNNKTKKIEEGFPSDWVCARHTQGLKHDLVLPYLKSLFK
ncbi:hypothetical protein [Flagellimonas beolgyonensis]|uniref:hypothetical protein n=1 Tax=Flagellimonas beolgyonensis TaxID=864064 RepID=UPI000F8C7E14|nr:hypothetical protein [Allomuricauda beolgyonensis]